MKLSNGNNRGQPCGASEGELDSIGQVKPEDFDRPMMKIHLKIRSRCWMIQKNNSRCSVSNDFGALLGTLQSFSGTLK